MSTEKGFDTSFALRVAVAVGIAIALVSLLAMLWLALDVLLLVFAGILVAVMLRGLADLLARHSFLRGAGPSSLPFRSSLQRFGWQRHR